MGLERIPDRLTTVAYGLLLLLQVQGEALVGVTGNHVRAAKLCRGRVKTKGGSGQGVAEMVEFIAQEPCTCMMLPQESEWAP